MRYLHFNYECEYATPIQRIIRRLSDPWSILIDMDMLVVMCVCVCVCVCV